MKTFADCKVGDKLYFYFFDEGLKIKTIEKVEDFINYRALTYDKTHFICPYYKDYCIKGFSVRVYIEVNELIKFLEDRKFGFETELNNIDKILNNLSRI
jgi:hypothetical protein